MASHGNDQSSNCLNSSNKSKKYWIAYFWRSLTFSTPQFLPTCVQYSPWSVFASLEVCSVLLDRNCIIYKYYKDVYLLGDISWISRISFIEGWFSGQGQGRGYNYLRYLYHVLYVYFFYTTYFLNMINMNNLDPIFYWKLALGPGPRVQWSEILPLNITARSSTKENIHEAYIRISYGWFQWSFLQRHSGNMCKFIMQNICNM